MHAETDRGLLGFEVNVEHCTPKKEFPLRGRVEGVWGVLGT